jgi:hypothetical protein
MINPERLQQAVNNPHPSDCYATALFLANLTDQDQIPITEIRRQLKRCTEIMLPTPGCLVHIYNGFVSHLAVVVEVNPTTVAYRNGKGGEVVTNVPIADMLFDYGGLDIGLSYLNPCPQND